MKIKKVFITILIFIISISLVGCKKTTSTKSINNNSDFTNIVFTNNGHSDYTILIPKNPTVAISYAAEELQLFVNEATGTKLNIKEETTEKFNESNKVISIGETNVKKESGIIVDAKELTNDGYKIERKGNTVIICGGDDSGSAYGVYEFLTREFNFEVYADDEIYLETTEKAYLYDFNVKDIPSFEGRSVDNMTISMQDLAHRLRIRCPMIGNEKYDYSASKDFLASAFCESFFTWISPDIYQDEHPEWFSGRTLCLSNEDLKTEMVKNICKALEEDTKAVYVNIAEEDGAPWCSCSICKSLIDQYKISGYLIYELNEIIERIEKWVSINQPGRELKYITFAYSSGSVHPPVKIENDKLVVIDEKCIPHEKLYIRFAPIEYCYSHALTDSSCSINVNCANDIKGWSAITDRFMVWDYEVNYSNYFMFFNYYDALQRNLLDYKEMGVVNIYRQSNTNTLVASMDNLKLYLDAKLMWNVNLSQEELTKDFMEHYYKAGASYMMEYFNMTRAYLKSLDLTRSNGLHFQLYDSYQPMLPQSSVWTKRYLEQALSLFDEAMAEYDKMADKELSEKLKLRVLKESFCVRYLILKNYGNFYDINGTDYINMIDQWEKDMETLQAYSYSEGGNTSSFIEYIRP